LAIKGNVPMKHVVLVGDSIFDNAPYVGDGPDVIKQVQSLLLPMGWTATLKARDGDLIADVQGQIATLPMDASHLVVSVGGNDALTAATVLEEPVHFVYEALEKLAVIRTEFQRAYRKMLDEVQQRGLPVAICTIYDARAPAVGAQPIVSTALSVFNDCITREAFARDMTLIDLRVICDSDQDFSEVSSIEPSVIGGEKIARAICQFATQVATRRSQVIARP
jgi:hypothetical protein